MGKGSFQSFFIYTHELRPYFCKVTDNRTKIDIYKVHGIGREILHTIALSPAGKVDCSTFFIRSITLHDHSLQSHTEAAICYPFVGEPEQILDSCLHIHYYIHIFITRKDTFHRCFCHRPKFKTLKWGSCITFSRPTVVIFVQP